MPNNSRFGSVAFRFAVLALVASLVPWTGLRADPDPGPDGTGIAGVVRSPDGAGITGAEVVAVAGSAGGSRRVVSGEHGVYHLAGLAAGEYTIEVWLAGSKRLVQGPFSIGSGETRLQDFELRLDVEGDTLEVAAETNRDQVMGTELREAGARDVAEALTVLPGVWKLRKGGIANDVVLRGYQGENLNVLIDGVRVQGACPNNMDPGVFHVDLAEVDRVEVSRGPFDVKNVGSLGGVVNVVTKAPQKGFQGEVTASGGSFGYFNPMGTVSYGGDKVSALAGASYRSSDPYKDGDGAAFTEVADYKPSTTDTAAFRVTAGWAGLYLSPTEKNHFRFAYSGQQADHVLYPYLLMDGVYDNTDRFQAGYERISAGAGMKALRIQGYYTHVAHWMTDELRNSSNMAPRPYGMGTYAQTSASGGRVEAEWTALTLGMEITRRQWNAKTMIAGMMYMPQYSIPDVTATTVGLYGLYDQPLFQGLALKAGARIDRFRSVADARLASTSLYYAFHDTRNTANDYNGASGNLRLLWTPTPALEVAAGVGSTLRGPDPQEFYIALKRMGADWVGNPDLNPARNTGLNLDVAYRRDGYSLRATVYRDSVHDFITVYDQVRLHMVPGVMSPVAKSYANVDAVLYGGELSATAVLGQRFFLSADAAAVRGTKDPRRDLGMASENLSEIPPFTGRVAGRYDDGKYFAELEGVFSAAQDEVDGDLQETPTPGWGICNLRLGAKWKGLSLTVAANNLFDRYYAEYLSYQRDPYRSGVRIPEPGRNLTLTLGWRF